MEKKDFVVVGTGGGGGTIAWLLARAGYTVTVLEQGPDWAETFPFNKKSYEREFHDEYKFRLEKPDPKRRPRGDYNTFRDNYCAEAKPFHGGLGGWTGNAVGGGSLLWGGWALRALPIDLKLGTLYGELNQSKKLNEWGYSVVDWPIEYKELEPYLTIAEILLSVCGNRDKLNQSIKHSEWFKVFSECTSMKKWGNTLSQKAFPSEEYPQNPVGEFFSCGMKGAEMFPAAIPSAMVNPNLAEYCTQDMLKNIEDNWNGIPVPKFWRKQPEQIWSNVVRDGCTMCGFCGEYVCWGARQPKSGSFSTTIRELRSLEEVAELKPNSKVYEIVYDERLKRATGVRYLDISDPNNPQKMFQPADNVILCAGAVQSTRILLMSGPQGGLGNSNGLVGRNAMFHTFGLGAKYILPEKFTGVMHSEFGHTGTTVSFSDYFIQDECHDWWKSGIVVGIAKKNPLENADAYAAEKLYGLDLLSKMELYPRTVELRVTGDDLPHPMNKVDLDPKYVDEYGFPVARITRKFMPHELEMFKLSKKRLSNFFEFYHKEYGLPIDYKNLKYTSGKVDLIGDHQMGTCRMGDDPATSVTNRYGRLHGVKNVFIADTSVFPTGLGVNPMVTTVANALRIGTYIVEQNLECK